MSMLFMGIYTSPYGMSKISEAFTCYSIAFNMFLHSVTL